MSEIRITALARAVFAELDEDGPQDWRDLALCAQADPDAFYPEKGEPSAPAKQVCRKCPVRDECLADAIARGEQYGVWGGMSERERRLTRRVASQGDVAAAA